MPAAVPEFCATWPTVAFISSTAAAVCAVRVVSPSAARDIWSAVAESSTDEEATRLVTWVTLAIMPSSFSMNTLNHLPRCAISSSPSTGTRFVRSPSPWAMSFEMSVMAFNGLSTTSLSMKYIAIMMAAMTPTMF